MEIVNQLLKNKAKVITVDGKSGSGKTTFARSLASKLNAFYLPLDLFHRHERKDWNMNTNIAEFEDVDKIKSTIARFKKGEKFVLENAYNHSDGTFSRSFKVEPKERLVIEGMFASMIDADFKIFLDIDPMVALIRGKERDMKERNLKESEWAVKKHLFHDEYSKYIPQLKKKANLVIDTTNGYPEVE